MNYINILTYYSVGIAVAMLGIAFVNGISGGSFDKEDTLDSFIWPITLSVIIGSLTGALLNIQTAKKEQKRKIIIANKARAVKQKALDDRLAKDKADALAKTKAIIDSVLDKD